MYVVVDASACGCGEVADHPPAPVLRDHSKTGTPEVEGMVLPYDLPSTIS